MKMNVTDRKLKEVVEDMEFLENMKKFPKLKSRSRSTYIEY